jgi:hypothetical protein
LLLAWETRLPTAGFFPVTSQTRDIHLTLREIRYLEIYPTAVAAPGPGFIPAPPRDLKAHGPDRAYGVALR